MRVCKGSITVFALLSMLLVVTTVLSMLELSRYHAIRQIADLQTKTALESGFANYSGVLWEEYRMLACEEEILERNLQQAGEGRNEHTDMGHNLLLFENQDVDITGCVRLTDADGFAFRQSVSAYMERNLAYEVVKGIYNQYQAIQQLRNSSEFDVEDIDIAIAELEKAEKLNEEKESKDTPKSIGTSKETTVQNPLEEFKRIQEMGILDLVLEDTENISKAKIDKTDRVSKRTLTEGTMNLQEDEDWLDWIYLQQYLLSYFSSYGQEKEGHQLMYELEYLIGGKESDIKNLNVVVLELFSIRAVCNFLYLMSDAEKLDEAGNLAIVLSGGNLQLIELVKVALLTAWAFGESVLDIRALLNGKKVALIKNQENWTLELTDLTMLTQKENMAKETDSGLSYQEYLGILLLFLSSEKVSMRSMDIQEATIRKKTGNESFCMDMLVVQAEARIRYGYKPIFLIFDELNIQRIWNYEIVCQETYGYL